MLERVVGEKVDGGVHRSRFALDVSFLMIERSKNLTLSLVSCVVLSLMLPWIVSM